MGDLMVFFAKERKSLGIQKAFRQIEEKFSSQYFFEGL